jgi:hypothetical protein
MALHVWRVLCPNNSHLTTLVTSPLRPRFCPVCGGESLGVIEMEQPRRSTGYLAF